MSEVLLVSLLAALSFALGNVMQKAGFLRLQASGNGSPKGALGWIRSLFVSPFWVAGMVMSALAVLLQYYAMARWNLSTVQPILALNPILTSVIGRLSLKEEVNRRTLVALFVGFVGIVMMGFRGKEIPGSMDSTLGIWVFAILSTALIVFLHYFHRLSAELRYSLAAGLGFGASVVLYKACVFKVETIMQQDLGSIVLGVLTFPLLWFYTATYIFGFLASQAALAKGRAMVVVPLSAGIGTALPVLGGILLYHEPLSALKTMALVTILLSIIIFFPNQSGHHQGAK